MPTAADVESRVHRIEVRPLPEAGDPKATQLLRDAEQIGVTLADARTARVYLIEGALSDDDLAEIIDGLLVNPAAEIAEIAETNPVLRGLCDLRGGHSRARAPELLLNFSALWVQFPGKSGSRVPSQWPVPGAACVP